MNEIKFEKVYDLTFLLYNDMQLHPAIEVAGAHSRVLMHGFPVHLPSMGEPKGGTGVRMAYFSRFRADDAYGYAR